jgi:hypothetical protein
MTTTTAIILSLAYHHRELRFDSTDVTQFLKRYNGHALISQTSNVAHHSSTSAQSTHEDFIEQLSKYEASNWEGLLQCLKEYYALQDHTQYASNHAYLESFVQQCSQHSTAEIHKVLR